ncbi:MAG TPA: response regulator transcription factor [Anaerolineales bacterium]|nr:response regulator transcription factor [Anaerolineales bacterium]
MYKVIIVEDQELTASGHANPLKMPDFSVIATYHDRKQLRQSPLLNSAHLILLDLKLPEERSDSHAIGTCVPTIDLVSDLIKQYPSLRIVLLTNESSQYYILHSKIAGAHGYLVKSQVGLAGTLPETLLSILADGRRIFPEADYPSEVMELSEAELRVLIAKIENPGKSSKHVGQLLGSKSSTVRNHLSSAYKKLGVNSLDEARQRLLELGMA